MFERMITEAARFEHQHVVAQLVALGELVPAPTTRRQRVAIKLHLRKPVFVPRTSLATASSAASVA